VVFSSSKDSENIQAKMRASFTYSPAFESSESSFSMFLSNALRQSLTDSDLIRLMVGWVLNTRFAISESDSPKLEISSSSCFGVFPIDLNIHECINKVNTNV